MKAIELYWLCCSTASCYWGEIFKCHIFCYFKESPKDYSTFQPSRPGPILDSHFWSTINQLAIENEVLRNGDVIPRDIQDKSTIKVS